MLGGSGPIVFQPTDKDITIAADGNVTVLEGTNRIDSVRGKLRLVSFADAQKLVKEGSNLYSAGHGTAAQPDIASQVRQGFVEKSNVNSVAEMSRMIEVTRAYTSISAMLQQQGDLRKTAHRETCRRSGIREDQIHARSSTPQRPEWRHRNSTFR